MDNIVPFMHTTKPEDITFDPKPECREEDPQTNQVPLIENKTLKEGLIQEEKTNNN